MYIIVRKIREYEDVYNLAKGLMNDSESIGNKIILRSLAEVSSTLSQVEVLMLNQASFLDAQEGLYAKGEELWEKVIMSKTDNIKNMLENHYQIVLDPELLSEGIESSDALQRLDSAEKHFNQLTNQAKKYLNYLRFLNIQFAPDFNIKEQIEHALKYRKALWTYSQQFHAIVAEIQEQ